MDVVEETIEDNPPMSDETKQDDAKSDESRDPNAKTQLDIGALLVEARENKHLTSQDIAKQMNLTLLVITKIESNEFVQDIPLAFIRGYVRSYAQKVGLDAENLCAEFDRQTQEFSEPLHSIKVVSSFKSSRREINSSSFVFKFITFLIVTALLAFGGWELWKRLTLPSTATNQPINEIELSGAKVQGDSIELSVNDKSQDNTASSTSNIAPDEQINDMAEFSQAAAVGEQMQNDANESDSEADAVTQVNELKNSAPPKPEISGPIVSMNFQFSGDCWVKVTDANDEVLAIGIKRSGKLMPLEGIAPVTVILGEPTAVNIEYQGKAYDLSRFKAGDTARFVLQ